MKSEKEKRYDKEEELFEPVTIKNLVCKDCMHAYDNPQLVSKCEKYPDIKPAKVLYGKDCEKYLKNI